MIDLLLHRYSGNLLYIMDMNWQDGFNVIAKAHRKETEEKAWQMWLMKYINMTKDSFIPFSEFYKKITEEPVKLGTHSKEELLKLYAEMRDKT
jgi:hypothetical protein